MSADDVPTPQPSATPGTSGPAAMTTPAPHQDGRERPMGVTLIGVLYALVAGVFLLGGLMLIVGGGVMAAVLASFVPGWGGTFGALGGVFFVIMGLVVAAVGALLVFVAVGVFKGRGWAWTTALVVAAVSAVFDVLSLFDGDASVLVSLAISALIVWYLFEPAPKAFFGKAQVRAFWQKEKAPAS